MTETEATEPEKTIDELLGDFEKPSEVKPQTKSEFGEVLNFVKEFQSKEAQKEIDAGIDDAVKFIKSDESITVSDRMVKGLLNVLAEENPRVLESFNNRAQNPAAWEDIKKWAQTEVKKEFSIEPKITDDIAAAKAAASGQTTDEPEPVKVSSADLDGLNELQFKEFKTHLGRGTAPDKALKLVK